MGICVISIAESYTNNRKLKDLGWNLNVSFEKEYQDAIIEALSV